MEWLKQWVRELVMLVLLAGCLDLLVPMGSLKKYIRMVMGLLVMVTLLNPILALWKADVRVDDVLAQHDARLPSMKAVQADAERYRARVEAQIGGQFRLQIESRAAMAAKTVEGVGEASAQAEVSQSEGQEPSITRIHVYIAPEKAVVSAVQPVEAVRFGDKPCAQDGGADDCQATGKHGAAGRPGALASDDPVAGRVRLAVAATLAIDPDLVMVLAKEAR